MKKSLVAASFILLSGSILYADQNPWFVGGEFGGMNMKYKFDGALGAQTLNINDTVKATYESIKIGKYFDYGRIYTSVVRQNKKDDFSSWSGGLGYDYLFKNSTAITPFLGVNGLYTEGKDKTSLATRYQIDSPKGFSYGAEAGLIYAASTNIDLEIGTRYMDSSDVQDSRIVGANHGKFEGKTTLQYYVGLNYKF